MRNPYYRWRYYPEPVVPGEFDADGDGSYDVTFDSEMFVYVLSLEDFFNVTVDVEDGLESFGFKIIAYDVWSVSETNVTDYEIMDYSPSDGLESVDHQISLPFDGVWESSGAEDGDTPDCELVYSVTTSLSG